MNRLTAVMKWIAMNALMAAALWWGLVEGVAGAKNVGLAMVWWVVVCSLATTGTEFRKELAKKEMFPSVPRWIDGGFDIAIAVLLLWHGLMITGIAYAISGVLNSAMYSAIADIRSSANSSGEGREV